MRKIVIILYGPPGSGKGTQANLLADKFRILHFDTGKILEGVVHDPKRQKEAVIRRERRLFDTGKLMTPSFVAGEVVKAIKNVAAADWGLVFSGSPRTIYEAEKEYPVLEKLYGKKNIFVFLLDVPSAHSMRRNSARLVCSVCGYILLTAYYPKKNPKHCPICAGTFYKRSVDNPKIIPIRLAEYEKRTMPILDFVKKRGYAVHRLDARPAPYKVLHEIVKKIKTSDK